MANEKTKVNNLDAANISSSTLIANTALITDASKNILSLANGSEGYIYKIVSGVPAWAAAAAAVAGSDTEVQYNDGGALAGAVNFNWNKTSEYLKLTKNSLAATSSPMLYLSNTTAATISVQFQASPALVFEGQAWKSTATTGSQKSEVRFYNRTEPGTAASRSDLRIETNNNSAGWTALASFKSGDATALTTPLSTFNGRFVVDYSNSNGTVGVTDHLTLKNTSGSTSHVSFSTSSTVKSSITSSMSSGSMVFRSAGSSPLFEFQTGSSIGSTSYVVQIYGSGIYCNASGFFGSKLTAGSADTTVQTTLSSYGSLAVKGLTVATATYTLSHTETMVYAFPDTAEVCSGTPATACSSYVSEGTCNAHTGVGCSWFAGNACSAYDGTDESSCETGHAGCTWEEVACSSTSPVDQTACEEQDDAYGGNCAWTGNDCSFYNGDSSGCAAQTGCSYTDADCSAYDGQSESACETGHTGCTWTGADCHAFDGTSLSGCEDGHTGCSWDGALCNGVYDEASTCTGTFPELGTCAGTYYTCEGNFNTGSCLGTYGAACQGTAACGNITNSVSCAAESGCSWVTGIALTLPTTGDANRSNTSRLYSIVHTGTTGTVSIIPNSGQTIFQYGSELTLTKRGDRALLHFHSSTVACSTFTSEGQCESYTGCTWNDAIVCSSFGSQEDCENAGCTWDGELETCSGAGSAANCSGTYTIGTGWFVHNLERGKSYVAKTASYTLVDIDDTVDVTANSVTITLPSAVVLYRKRYTIKNTGGGTVTLNTTSSQTIDGLASGVITLGTGDSIDVESNGANWIIT